ncbi:uncharacterized protein LOC100826217 [Brachypodium distachyon]|uniref:uncharacterized protein LOC100826217 n=1 Tax=Brachypodium distachyon TaxID=15368 RepID=UPI00052FEE91|nr:uncharacterized protein LOC100826217 [Brachypodium distachyon]|eukprot:XP_010233141.1 uncharacterized protein LOC100826217 [Brachypodium distachyon]
MDSRYTRWVHHGEELTDDEGHNFEDAGYQSDDDGYDQGNRDDVSNLLDDLYRSGRQADGQPNLFANLMEEAKKELYDGCTNFTRLSFIIKLLHVKSYNRVTNAAFDGFLKLFNLACPNGNLVPKSYSEAKSVLRDVGLDYEIIHVCKYECELFWGEYANHDHCPTCGTSRWKDTHGKKKVPQKVLRYFPIIPRLQRFFASKFLAEMAMWHKVKRVVDKDVMRHPADGEAWKGFDSEYGWFARDPRNLKLGIATDGFNPFGMGSSYRMWPVFVIPYNFPPWMCMDQSNFMMALLIPGRKSPGKDFHVYMKPLMADMKKLWEGVDTFDALTGKRFPLHAAILWSIHHYPGLATISGRSTKGFYACVHCDENPCSQSLRNKIGYVGHRRFLPTNHHFRTSKLFNGKAERRGPPRKFTIEEVMEKLGKVEDYKPGKHPDFKKRKRAEKGTPNWSQKVSFYDLPYWSKLKLPHNLDVMHIEKNICDNILGTLLEIDKKSKDTTNARKDLEDLRIRKKLHMRTDGKGGFEKPPACYTLSKENKKKLCQFLVNVKFPDGYAANLARCVDLDACKVHDLKTHDCHILLQRVLPAGLRGLVRQDIYEAITELGNFFKQLCSKTLRLDVLHRLKDKIPLILCKLEKIFPPAFFDVMVHLAVHLPDEAIQRGPVHYGWMYPVERRLGYLKGTVRNKARLEGSIAETYVVDECMIYCSRFLNDDVETRFNKDERNRDGKRVVDPAELPVFSVAAKAFGACRLKYFEKEYEKMVCVCREELLGRGVNNIDETVEKEFLAGFGSMYGDPEVSDDLHSLAFGLDKRVLVHSACNVNGVRFHTVDREKNRRTQNSGILTIAPDHNGVEKEYYGVLKQVLELQYLKNKHGDRSVFLFRCDWFDLDTKKNGLRDDGYFKSVNTSASALKYKNDPFILASQAKTVFYMDDTRFGKSWKVLQTYTLRHVYDVLESENGEDIDQGNQDAYQEDNSSSNFIVQDVEGEVNDEQRSDPDDEAASDADGQTMDDVGATEHEEISSSDDDEAAGDGEEANNSEHESDDD